MRSSALIFLVCSVIFVSGCSKPSLSDEEKRIWDGFQAKRYASGMTQPTPEDASAVAAIGDKIVPYIEADLGKSSDPIHHKSDYWLIVVLGRIGTPDAIRVIRKVVRHDYSGETSRDRETASKALVWLGATEGIDDLKYAIADTKKMIADERAKDKASGLGKMQLKLNALMDSQWLKTLERNLKTLERGNGIRDTKNFPFDRISRRRKPGK